MRSMAFKSTSFVCTLMSLREGFSLGGRAAGVPLIGLQSDGCEGLLRESSELRFLWSRGNVSRLIMIKGNNISRLNE